MSDIVLQRNIGALIAPVPSVRPQAASAGAINGVSIDRQAHSTALSCLLHQIGGAVTGAPTTSSSITKLQDSADNSTFADYVDPNTGVVATTAALSAANTDNTVAISLTSARRYIRAVTTVAFTGGTTPTAFVAADVILAGEDRLAAT